MWCVFFAFAQKKRIFASFQRTKQLNSFFILPKDSTAFNNFFKKNYRQVQASLSVPNLAKYIYASLFSFVYWSLGILWVHMNTFYWLDGASN
jgi:hypothetical protein